MIDFTTLPTPQEGERGQGSLAIGSRSQVTVTECGVGADWREALIRSLPAGDGTHSIELT